MNNNFLLFVSASLVLLVIPGPAVLYIVGRSIQQGSWAGVVSALGVVTGGLLHVAAATVGLSALIISSPTAIGIIKVFGGVYLIFLGISTLKKVEHRDNAGLLTNRRSYSKLYWDGFLVNLFNPKTILFFVAFLPQFIDWEKTDPQMQFLTLGVVLVLLGLFTDSIYALIAGKITKWLETNGNRRNLLDYIASVVYISLGIIAFLS